MRLFVEHFLSAVASRASPGVDEVRRHRPVRPGDQLRLRVSILETKPSRSKPDRGTVISLLEGLNQNAEVVCTLKAMNLLEIKGHSRITSDRFMIRWRAQKFASYHNTDYRRRTCCRGKADLHCRLPAARHRHPGATTT